MPPLRSVRLTGLALAVLWSTPLAPAAAQAGDQRPEPLTPGTAVEITVDLWNTSHVFRRGHRIRLEVASSSFPRYSRSLNARGQPETGDSVATARQTVFHEQRRPSRLILPVLSEP